MTTPYIVNLRILQCYIGVDESRELWLNSHGREWMSKAFKDNSVRVNMSKLKRQIVITIIV